MSRQLLPQPNLEHLRKQAKDRLEELTSQNPNAKLADALYALAREYGFASWPKLKVYVLSISPTASGGSSPFAGHWVVDLSRSKPQSLDEPRAASLDISVVSDTVTIHDTVIDASGHERHGENVLVVDGEEHSDLGNGYGIVANWYDARTLDISVVQGGEHVSQLTYQVSRDEATLTLSAVAKEHRGYPPVDRVTVFRR